MNNLSQNKILIAKPFLQDAFFRRSVILLADHNKSGSVGFIMNRPIQIKLNDLIKEFSGADIPVFLGGPVSQDQLFFVHPYGDKIAGSHFIGNGYFWNGDYHDLLQLSKEGEINQNKIKFLLGYSGWSSGQLEDEIKSDSWLISDCHYQNLLRNAKQEIWRNELERIGNRYSVLSNFPSDPWMN